MPIMTGHYDDTIIKANATKSTYRLISKFQIVGKNIMFNTEANTEANVGEINVD